MRAHQDGEQGRVGVRRHLARDPAGQPKVAHELMGAVARLARPQLRGAARLVGREPFGKGQVRVEEIREGGDRARDQRQHRCRGSDQILEPGGQSVGRYRRRPGSFGIAAAQRFQEPRQAARRARAAQEPTLKRADVAPKLALADTAAG